MDDAYCPECGAGSIFNGMSGDTPCWLCPACGHQWAAVPGPARAVTPAPGRSGGGEPDITAGPRCGAGA